MLCLTLFRTPLILIAEYTSSTSMISDVSSMIIADNEVLLLNTLIDSCESFVEKKLVTNEAVLRMIIMDARIR